VTEHGGWLRRFHEARPDAPRLVCLPHAGGSASAYFPFSAALSRRVATLLVQYPGRQDRRAEPPATRLADLAEVLSRVLRPLADEPLALFGHSMGAVLGYEVALRLQDDGAPPLLRLFASGRRAPSRYRTEAVHRLDDDMLVAHVCSLGGVERAVFADPEVQAMLIPVLRADYTAAETYRHEPGRSLTCPITVLVGDADPLVTLDEALTWKEHTQDSTDLKSYPGGHFYLTTHLASVTDAIAERLGGTSPD
jgi:pyochelin biosynthesis protein PchC